MIFSAFRRDAIDRRMCGLCNRHNASPRASVRSSSSFRSPLAQGHTPTKAHTSHAAQTSHTAHDVSRHSSVAFTRAVSRLTLARHGRMVAAGRRAYCPAARRSAYCQHEQRPSEPAWVPRRPTRSSPSRGWRCAHGPSVHGTSPPWRPRARHRCARRRPSRRQTRCCSSSCLSGATRPMWTRTRPAPAHRQGTRCPVARAAPCTPPAPPHAR